MTRWYWDGRLGAQNSLEMHEKWLILIAFFVLGDENRRFCKLGFEIVIVGKSGLRYLEVFEFVAPND